MGNFFPQVEAEFDTEKAKFGEYTFVPSDGEINFDTIGNSRSLINQEAVSVEVTDNGNKTYTIKLTSLKIPTWTHEQITKGAEISCT